MNPEGRTGAGPRSGAPASLANYLVASAGRRPDHIAVVDPGRGEITYRDLDRLTDRLRDRLVAWGVRPGDRVGICLRKSIDSIAAIFGIQKAGAAHVPVDAGAPASRNAYIFENCAVRAVIGEGPLLDLLRAEWGDRMVETVFIPLDFDRDAVPLRRALDALDSLDALAPAPATATHAPAPDDLAYILYTSGSTGKPKGVAISQRNATVFVDWCSDTFGPREDDRFSSHAPFHFDLSVLDIYVPLKHGATLVLFSEQTGKDPVTMAAMIAEQKLTCWYSAPSILSLLTQYGHLERFDWSNLRIIHFAGEVFPVKHLRALKRQIPHPRYFNLYGPTETNVCTFYEIPEEVPEERSEPYPIGKACAHYRRRIVDLFGHEVAQGEEGELWIAGPGVMLGYWNNPERDAEVFRDDPDGTRWYRTGDLTIELPDGNMIFRGRRDRMVKKRGYRIELGEIEAALYKHPDIKEAAVISMEDQEQGVRIRAFLSVRSEKPSIIRLKQFCAAELPSYMIPDLFTILDRLPKTSTDKTDYQVLKETP